MYAPIRDWLLSNPSYITNKSGCIDKLLYSTNVAYLNEITSLETIQQRYCQEHKLIILNDRFFPAFIALGLQKNSTLSEILSEE